MFTNILTHKNKPLDLKDIVKSMSLSEINFPSTYFLFFEFINKKRIKLNKNIC